jgi:hypothetical protein
MMTAACRHSRSEDARDADQGDDWVVVSDRVEMQQRERDGSVRSRRGTGPPWLVSGAGLG